MPEYEGQEDDTPLGEICKALLLADRHSAEQFQNYCLENFGRKIIAVSYTFVPHPKRISIRAKAYAFVRMLIFSHGNFLSQ